MTTCALAIGLLALGQNHHVQDRGKFGGYFMQTTTVVSGTDGSKAANDVVIAKTVIQWDKLRSSIGISDEQNRELMKLHGPLGAMDWTKEQLVFVRSKQQNSGGFRLDVQKVVRERDTWRVDLALTGPKAGEMSIMVLTTPYVVFRCRKVSGQPSVFIHPITPK